MGRQRFTSKQTAVGRDLRLEIPRNHLKVSIISPLGLLRQSGCNLGSALKTIFPTFLFCGCFKTPENASLIVEDMESFQVNHAFKLKERAHQKVQYAFKTPFSCLLLYLSPVLRKIAGRAAFA